MNDLISRQDAIDACFNGKCANIYDCKEAIEKIPSAQKTGKWQKYEGRFDYNWECSECECSSYEKTSYCAHCGARME